MSKYQRFEDVELWVGACSKPEVDGKSGGEHAALETLREVHGHLDSATASGLRDFSTAFVRS